MIPDAEHPLKLIHAVCTLIVTVLAVLGVWLRSEQRIDLAEERIRVMQVQVDHVQEMTARLIRIEDKVDMLTTELNRLQETRHAASR